jgi:methionyl-tRNA formyltransferase
MKHVEVVAIVTKQRPFNAWWKNDPFDISKDKNLTCHSELRFIEFDFGVSINYWKIIEPEIIKQPRLGFVNLHHSYNLCLRGRNMTSHAILNARKSNRWYHGSSLHYMDNGLDTGPIIASRSCDLTETDTSWTLFNKAEKLGEDLLIEWLPRLIHSKAPAAYPEADNPINMNLVDSDKFISDIDFDPVYTYDFVRAFDFKNYYAAAYTCINGSRVNLTTDQELADHILLKIDSNRKVYALREFKCVAT